MFRSDTPADRLSILTLHPRDREHHQLIAQLRGVCREGLLLTPVAWEDHGVELELEGC